MGILIIPVATTAQRMGITPAVAELIYDTTLNVIFRGNGATVGGVALADSGGVLTVTGPNVNNTDPTNPIVNARVVSIGAGTNITVNNADPNNPIVSASAASGGQVNTVVGGTSISVNATDPVNPIVNFTGTLGGQVNTVVGTASQISVNIADPVNPVVSLAAAVVTSLALANTAIQAQTLQLSGAYSDEGVTNLVASTTVPVWSKRVGYPFSLTSIADPVNPVVSLAAAVVTSLALANTAIQAGDTILDGMFGLIQVVTDTTYTLMLRAAYAGVITAIGTRMGAGTCTVQIRIGGTPLGGSSNSATTTYSEQVHATDNIFAVNDIITMVITASAASPANLDFVLKMVRIL